jgi:hypothetical protein
MQNTLDIYPVALHKLRFPLVEPLQPFPAEVAEGVETSLPVVAPR